MSQEPFGDIPLFREIQRLLASSTGPVNYEIARQVASAVATEGTAEPPVSAEVTRAFARVVHDSEGVISGFTRIVLQEPLQSHVMVRKEWAATTLNAWAWLLDRLAGRFGTELGGFGDGEDAGAMGAAMGQIVPLLMGIQAGTLVGHLARELLGRFDVPIPRDDDGRLIIIRPNVEAVAVDYGLDVDRLSEWLALQETARGLVAANVAWIDRYFRSLLNEIIDSIEIDGSELERRLVELQSQGMEMLQEGLSPGNALPVVPTERHRRALDRLHAFMALFEGYSRYACSEVSGQVIGDTTRIDEGMARHNLSPSDGEEMLASLLGLSLDRSLESTGTTFCAAVVKLHGIDSLNRVWGAPDNLPTVAEVRDPFAWMERVLSEA
ncbi:MAG: zinc-dependent metalloprotease [Actinomycetota bacterium]